MKVQIRDFDVRIRELSDYVRMCPLVQQVYIAQQNDRIRELQEALDEAKKKKRIVTAELVDTNRHNKQVLENHKMARKLLYDNLQQEMEEHRRKKSDMRAEKKQAKDAAAVVGPKKVKIRVVPPVSTGDGV
jgi:adenine-specific DNA glycosylase